MQRNEAEQLFDRLKEAAQAAQNREDTAELGKTRLRDRRSRLEKVADRIREAV